MTPEVYPLVRRLLELGLTGEEALEVYNSTVGYGQHWSDPVPVKLICSHEFVDTGMRKTWCKKCNIEGYRDPMLGTIEIVIGPAKDKESDK